jgi:hypothetical protein
VASVPSNIGWDATLGEFFIDHEWPTPRVPIPNTFRSNPQPREGYIDARRDDGCVTVITTLEES